MRSNIFFSILLVILSSCSGISQNRAYIKLDDGIIVKILAQSSNVPKTVRLQVVTNDIIHISASVENKISQSVNLIDVYNKTMTSGWIVEEEKGKLILKTATTKAIITLLTGEIVFTDIDGNILLAEKEGGGKSLDAIELDGKKAYISHQVFDSPNDEAFYGLGQHQSDEFNYKGRNEELFQYNTKVSVPFIISSKKYGILWNNYSVTRFGDIRDYGDMNQFKLSGKNGELDGLTATYTKKKSAKDKQIVRTESIIDYENIESARNFPSKISDFATVVWEGEIQTNETGKYHFRLAYGGYVKLYIDNELIVPERWRASYIPNNSYKFEINMISGKKQKLKIEWRPDGNSFIGLKVLSPRIEKEQGQLSFWSEAGENIDYYFIRGNNLDEVIKGYRTITGKAPIMPKWALGFWQSRDKYINQFETVGVVKEYRKRNIPIDNIVQDWHFWPENTWGSHDFNPVHFPRPKAMVDSIHNMNARIMITIWPKFYRGTPHYEAFEKNGWLYEQPIKQNLRDFKGQFMSYYDAFSTDARKLYWDQINKKLYSKGIDAWWLDASEPSIQDNISIMNQKELMNPTALGSSTQYFTAYPMLNSKGVYEGQRSVNPNERVFILTRSGFIGSQHYASAIWSGDVAARWEDYKAQISAGLNFAMSGIPYWTTDIGGYCVEKRFDQAKEGSNEKEEWRELYTRWFQFGAFSPIFRSHGKAPFREIYNIAPENHPAYLSTVYYNKLRYRLMPYIYSIAGMTYHSDYTIMRALVMDFTNDTQTHNISDQYMFGPNMMICPVYSYKTRERSIYFPKGANWYDYESGKYIEGDQTLSVNAPYERIPIYIKAGSIIPMGKDIQSTKESQAAELTLRVYKGQDGEFTLYEDEETNNNYEKGAFSTITFTYNDKEQELRIGQVEGKFENMLKNRSFHIEWISKDSKSISTETIDYKGLGIRIKHN